MEQTIRELCKRVAARKGLDTDMESVTAYQDLIGHASVQENHELANTPELKETFYWIYGVAYGTVEAIKFYHANSDKLAKVREEREEYKAKVDTYVKANQDLNGKLETKDKIINELNRDMDGTMKALDEAREIIAARDAEIMALKAKLYDLEHVER